jgi:hypothetical protein
MINTEFWKPVKNYEDCYLVSDQGNVLRIKKARACTFVGKRLKHDIGRENIHRVTLCDKRRLLRKMVYQLVMEAFVGPYPPGKQINHKDGNRHNNSLYNLEYVTASENCIHAVKNGLYKTVGENHHSAKLTRVIVDKIREDYKVTPEKHRDLAKKYGVTKSTITSILNHKIWKDYK